MCGQAVTVLPPVLHSMYDQCARLCLPSLQIFFPLAPGIESIWDPFQEEVQERYDEVQRQIDDVVDGMQHAWLMHCLTSCNMQIPSLNRRSVIVCIVMCMGFARNQRVPCRHQRDG